jgi:uncharacterized membrane protein YozB (DUF420 family)
MGTRWLWAGTMINALLFLPGAYMAASAVNIARDNELDGPTLSIAALFLALPVFCIAVPLTAWRTVKRGRSSGHTVALLLSPVVYAAFLVILLMNF